MDGIKYQLAVISDQLVVHAGWFSWAFTGGCLDRMAGLQDLQDRLFWLNWGLFGQDYRISGFTG